MKYADYYDRHGYCLLQTSDTTVAKMDKFASLYPNWKTAIYYTDLAGMKGDVPVRTKKLLKIVVRSPKELRKAVERYRKEQQRLLKKLH